jgi:hypothetical protein
MTRLQDDLGYRVQRTGSNQHYTYTVGELLPFQICTHNRGQSQVKVCYVKAFLARMTELGLY